MAFAAERQTPCSPAEVRVANQEALSRAGNQGVMVVAFAAFLTLPVVAAAYGASYLIGRVRRR